MSQQAPSQEEQEAAEEHMTHAERGRGGLGFAAQGTEGVVLQVGQGGAEATEQPGESSEDEDGAADGSSERGAAPLAHRRLRGTVAIGGSLSLPRVVLPDLHRHLDGSLRLKTLAELAEERGLVVPASLGFWPGMGLDAALAQFAFTLSLLDTADSVSRVAAECAEDAEADGVSALELRFAPHLHGPPLDVVVDAALRGLDGRAGLILCVLYGDAPDLAEALVDLAIPREGVVGIDLAGGPSPAHRWGMRDYAPAFQRAGRHGLGRTVHAGEGRAPAEIGVAIQALGAERIGHGTTVLEDPAITELVLRREVTLEACLTSNWQVGVIDELAAHPLPRWLDLGIRACINTDNTLLSDTTSGAEHGHARALPGMTDALLERAIHWGRAGRFTR